MPNLIDDFVPYRILRYVAAQLDGISTAMGYNTDPAVFDRFENFNASNAKFSILFETTGEDPDLQGVGGDGALVQQSIEVHVAGKIKYETEHPRRLAMALEQDVRTALHSGVADIRSSVGRGCSFRFGSLTHDGGVLAPEKESRFVLTVSYTWSQRSDW